MKREIIILLVAMSAIAFSTIIVVDVGSRISFSSMVNYSTGNLTVIKISVENTGSLKCTAQAKAEDGEQKFWSERVEMEPGDYEELKIYYLSPYRDAKNLSVYVYFCDEVRKVGSVRAMPSSARPGKPMAEVHEDGRHVYVKGNAIVIPFNNPANVIIPTINSTSEAVARIYYPEPMSGNLTFILTNGTSYSIITVMPSHGFPWIPAVFISATAFAFYLFARKHLHGRPGRAENGRRHPAKGKRRAKRKNKA